MDQQSYQQIYVHYIESATQTMLFADSAMKVFEDFPNKLPREIIQPLIDNVNDIANITKIIRDGGKIPPPYKMDSSFSTEVIINLAMGRLPFIRNPPSVSTDFDRLLCLQTLVMIIAHLDAFISDSFRTIYQVCPKALKGGDKQIDVSTIMSCGTWENLIDFLIEHNILKFGMKSLTERMERLGKLGLEIKPGANMLLLEQAAEIRHIIVHNGGKVNQKYISKTKQQNITVGEPVPITYEYVRKVSSHSHTLVFRIYDAINRKFFNVEVASDNPVKT